MAVKVYYTSFSVTMKLKPVAAFMVIKPNHSLYCQWAAVRYLWLAWQKSGSLILMIPVYCSSSRVRDLKLYGVVLFKT